LLALIPPGPLWIDVEAFEAAAAAARRTQDAQAYAAAAALYGGDLAPEDRYEDWAANRREALHVLYLALLLELARLYEARGEQARAIETLQRVIACDPAHEQAHAALMRAYALAGQRQQALRQYQQLRAALQRELDAEPDPATQQLHQEILAGRYAGELPLTAVPSPSRGGASPLGTGFPQSGMEGSVGGQLIAPLPPGERAPRGGLPQSGTEGKPKHNLPSAVTSFVGREREMETVRQLLASTRLLTLHGAGGCGKTRLALEVAATLRAEYTDGVWLVELAPLADPVLVPQAIAAALGVREEAGRPLLDTLRDTLRPKHLLLLLDNCEHLLPGCATVAGSLLRACPRLRLLATSREALRIAGETTWRVPSLTLPTLPSGEFGMRNVEWGTGAQHSAFRIPHADLAQSEAMRLFADRAAAAAPGFALTSQNAPVVAQVCRQLDGLPLAIELAAARVRVLSVEQIAARLDDHFRLLTGGSRTAPARQQTLQATVDWSYDLLTASERTLFHRLSVFAGGFTLEAAEAVVSDQAAGGRRQTLALHGLDCLLPTADCLLRSSTCSPRSWISRWCWWRSTRPRSATACSRRCGSTAPRSCTIVVRRQTCGAAIFIAMCCWPSGQSPS
jgi:predicted ATPase